MEVVLLDSVIIDGNVREKGEILDVKEAKFQELKDRNLAEKYVKPLPAPEAPKAPEEKPKK
jgi:hypothetical protein